MKLNLTEFLSSGAIFKIDSERFWLGWGEIRPFAERGEDLDAVSGFALYAPDFYLSDKQKWFAFPHSTILSLIELRSVFQESKSYSRHENTWYWQSPNFEGFAENMRWIQSEIARGSLRKAVPVVFARAEKKITASVLSAMLSQALDAPAHLQLYGIWNPQGEGILGLTPETLFAQTDRRSLQSMALAGTLSKVPGQNQDDAVQGFLNDPKERFEHQIVVEDIVERLKKFAQLDVGETRVLELPALYHLQTCIHAKLNHPLEWEKLIEIFHPTAALGIFPRQNVFSTLKFLDRDMPRFRFGAPFALLARDNSENGFISKCVVAIRNLQWREGMVWLGSGCGIVEQSKLEREWQELNVKRQSVLRAFGIVGTQNLNANCDIDLGLGSKGLEK